MRADTYDAAVQHAKDHFDQATTEHEMTVLHDDGLYRHLRFAKGDSPFYWYDLITWPECLVISGDMGAYHFSRLTDMFEFFAGSRQAPGINPHYWGEKLQGARPGRDSAQSYSEAKFKARVREWCQYVCEELSEDEAASLQLAIREALTDPDGYLASEDEARRLLHEFEHKGHRMEDSWEWDLREYDHHYLWCCWAIVAGIKQYRTAKTAA